MKMSQQEDLQSPNGSDKEVKVHPEMESSAAIDKSIVENVIMGSKSQSDTSTKVSETECKEDLSHSEKTNEDDSSEQSNTKKSRELKLLLALSKEANLDTNISRKRKGVEGNKSRDNPSLKNSPSDFDKISKVAAENKHHFKYPVTAESELEEELPKNDLNSSSDTPNKVKRRKDNLDEVSVGGATEDCSKRNRKTFSGDLKMFKPNKDAFCWRCHREGVNVACETCPRSYHQKCLKQTINNPDHWPCPECVAILRAENTQTRTEAMKGMTLEHLCRLLKFAVNRMIQCQGSEPFLHPVSDAEFPEYKKYIVQPMNLTMLLNNIKENNYGSTQAFEADAKWLLHNSIIFNSYQSKLTYSAKSIIKVCKQEMAEIENCPNCYLNANIKKSTWFVEVCPKPHILVWAKLKGFPYWPAKAMCTNSSGMVDVRFFGAHDRAWVHYKECFLYSEKDPNTFKQKRYDIEKCIEELNIYIENLRQAYGEFRYAPYRTPYDPNNETKQVQIFIPKYKQLRLRKKSFKLTAESKAEPDDVKEEKVEEEKASEDSSANPEDKFHVKPTDESLDHKDESRDGFSNVNSPENENDNDVTMEGYGTDDETIGEIDMERRKALAGKVNSKMEEDEEDDDTQVPSNISVESALPKRRARTPGGLSSTPGESKVLSRRKSEMDSAKKRLSTDETYPTQHKLSRRNSDQSVKSDSSRLSNISDKINRVDISENMEITLGNDDIGCVSISENISPPNGDSSRSGSDYGVEIKRKPVQVDIDNAEFSISPSSKLKISDQLIKRLSDAGDKIEGVKKSIVEKKSQTDILIEKFQDVVQHEVVDFNQPSTSSGDKKDASPQKSKSDTVVGDIAPVKDLFERESGSGTIILEEKSPSTSKSNDVSKENEIDCEKTDSKKDSAVQNPSEVIENDADSLELYDHSEETKTGDEVAVQKNPTVEITPDIGQKQKVIQTSITECTTKDDKTETESNKKPSDEDDTNVSENKKSDEGNRNSEMVNIVEGEETDSLDDIQIDKKNIFNIIHSSLNEMKNQNSINKELKNGDGHTPEETTQIIGNMIGSFKKDLPKSTDKSSANSNSIITDSSSKPVTPLIRDEKNEGSKDIRENEDSTSLIASANKKRKLSSGGMPSPQAKIVKLVPIESILNKNEEKVESPPKNQEKGKVVIKRLLSTSVPSSNSAKTISSSPATSSIEIEVDEIKSEPESDDDFTEMENLEAKRKYLSALNISEKLEDTDKNKANEIRTRAKAEEKREKCKIVDNLTRIIDNVALNYSAEHEGAKIAPKNPERSSNGSQEGEIFVKSFAKIQSTGNAKQRARKSFPTPSYASSVEKPNVVAPKPVILATKDISSANILTKTPKTVVSSSAHSITAPLSAKSITMPSSAHCSTAPSRAKILPLMGSANPSGAKTFQTLSNVLISEGKAGVSQAAVGVLQAPKTTDPSGSALTHVFFMPTTSGMNYCVPLQNPVLSAVPSTTSTGTPLPQQSLLKPSSSIPLNVKASQNYIPQSDEQDTVKKSAAANNLLNDLLNQPLASAAKNPEQPVQATSTSTTNIDNSNNTATTSTSGVAETQEDDEFAVLNSILTENVSRAVSDLLMRPPPKLKPRPPGILNQMFDEGTPSSAGTVTTRINSIAHRMGDYFRGMLIETLEEMGRSANPEAKIISLQMELETQRHRHDLEITELRKNICIILKDIQKAVLDEREKVIDETRAACEAEAIKRVELAKSKQWCATCSKEAQFYCCWNTSYCDYPCQQKNWPQHMSKCTQSIEKTNNTNSLPNRQSPQIVLRPAGPPKPGVGQRIVAKPTKVYPRASAPVKTYKQGLSSSNSHITVIETTPGSFELVGNGPVFVTGKMPISSPTVLNPKMRVTSTTSNMSPTSYALTTAPRSSPSSATLKSSSVSARFLVDDN